MYRPKFCAECGEKIIRLRWHLWTSRRFCEHCWPRFLKEQSIRLTAASVAVLVLGIAIGHSAHSATPPVVIQRSIESSLVSSSGKPPAATDTSRTSGINLSGSALTVANAPAPAAEEIYMCGARTRKGAPCSRRVHGPVRCWQHKGMPAMLPQEKLLIKD